MDLRLKRLLSIFKKLKNEKKASKKRLFSYSDLSSLTKILLSLDYAIEFTFVDKSQLVTLNYRDTYMNKTNFFCVKILVLALCFLSFSYQSLKSENAQYQAAMYGVATGVGVTSATKLAMACMFDESGLEFLLPPVSGVLTGLAVWYVLQAYYKDCAELEKARTKQRLELEKLIDELEGVIQEGGRQTEKFEQAYDLLKTLQKKEPDKFAQLLLTGLESRLSSLRGEVGGA